MAALLTTMSTVAERPGRLGQHLVDGGAVNHVNGEADHGHVVLGLQPLDDRFGPGLVMIDGHDGGALGSQPAGDGRADAGAGGAGDEGHPAVEAPGLRGCHVQSIFRTRRAFSLRNFGQT